MINSVFVPSVGESITSGVISKWHKNQGDYVHIGDLLLTLDTDKVASEITANQAGYLEILVPEGNEVKIGDIIAEIRTNSVVKDNYDFPDTKNTKLENEKIDIVHHHNLEKKEIETEMLEETYIDASIEKDLEDTITNLVTNNNLEQQNSVQNTSSDYRSVTRKKISTLRKKIATQLCMAQQTAAILTTFNEVDMSNLIKLRQELQESFQKKYHVKLGFMSFFIKAVTKALQDIPSLNVQMEGDEIIENHYYDIGVAVGTKKGLVVPVLRNCDKSSLDKLETELFNYATKAHEGKLTITDLQYGIFTISNGGVYGSLLSTPIINFPQSGILGMHTIQERAVVVNGEIVIRPMMYLALSYDHRLIDGREAVAFLKHIKENIEKPIALFLS